MGRAAAFHACGKQRGIGNADRRPGNRVPEFAQSFDPPLRPIAGDQRAVDAADRCAANPTHLDLGFIKRLVHTGLIGAQSTATLEDEHHTFERKTRCRDSDWRTVEAPPVITFCPQLSIFFDDGAIAQCTPGGSQRSSARAIRLNCQRTQLR